jgi:hypothetical protein
MQEKIHEKVNFSGRVADFAPRETIFIPTRRFLLRAGQFLPLAERTSEHKAAL